MPVPKEIIKISDYIWEIPKTYKKGMTVPARIYATKRLLEAMDDGVFDQITNVATLPGLVNYAFAMPDAHWGYGAPIGAVFASDPKKGGIISPGAVGFDVNCLEGNSQILSEHGYTQKIKDFKKIFALSSLSCFDRGSKRVTSTSIGAFMERKANPAIYEVVTENGEKILATSDHPFLTPWGMVRLEDLEDGDKVAINLFAGVEFTPPSKEIIVEEKDIAALKLPFNKEAIITELKKRELLPLAFNSPQLPYLIKLLSYNMGDGNLSFVGKIPDGVIGFWGKESDLEAIRGDVRKIGYTPSKVYHRKRSHRIKTNYQIVKFEAVEKSFKVGARSLLALLMALGAPAGRKASQAYRVPEFVRKSPLWQKRLFLSAYFGAEMTKPATMTNLGYNFYMPTISINKTIRYKKSGQEFLEDIKDLLAEFGVRSSEIVEVDKHTGRHGGKTIRLRLQLQETNDNLIKLYSKIGFVYNREKIYLGNVATQYLKFKKRVLDERDLAQKEAKVLYRGKGTAEKVIEALKSEYVSRRFLWRSIFGERRTSVRIAPNFPTFKDYLEERTEGLGKSGVVWEKITQKIKKPFKGLVYDFTVNHKDHNFIANNFVVSNCGMRLIRTDLTAKEVKPKLHELVDTLFVRVPSGVGSSGFLRPSHQEFKRMTTEGAKWCLKQGYGWEEDLEHLEEYGCLKGANPDKVSDKAIKRGLKQLGTLGSGNHYLEVQEVLKENIFDRELAGELGIFPGQIVVMVHCGSRGFGHQVATDYLRKFNEAMPKYGISVPDRELACAPFESREGQDYYAAMACASNSAFANRQVITHRVRECFESVFGKGAHGLGMSIVYDVAHNIAKVEKGLVVHRKGATRSFGPGNPELAPAYQEAGQPVILGGSMETGSYLLVGTKKAEAETFGSTAHGSGRTMSRAKAKKLVRGDKLQHEMEKRGIYVRSASMPGLAEEAGLAYKNISEVVEAVDKAGLSKKVVGLRPIGNVKG